MHFNEHYILDILNKDGGQQFTIRNQFIDSIQFSYSPFSYRKTGKKFNFNPNLSLYYIFANSKTDLEIAEKALNQAYRTRKHRADEPT